MIHNLVLSGGPTHAFDLTTAALAALLEDHDITSTVVTEPRDAFAALQRAQDGTGDVVDLFTVNALRWSMGQAGYAGRRAGHAVTLDPEDLAIVDRFVREGGGLLALHGAVICFDADSTWHRLCGASWQWGTSLHPPFGPAEIDVTPAGALHEITRDIGRFTIDDEIYSFLSLADDLEPLLVSTHSGQSHPLLWARQVGSGRVVTDLLGHGPDSFDHPAHRTVLSRAATWAAGRSSAGIDSPTDSRNCHP